MCILGLQIFFNFYKVKLENGVLKIRYSVINSILKATLFYLSSKKKRLELQDGYIENLSVDFKTHLGKKQLNKVPQKNLYKTNGGNMKRSRSRQD